MLTQRQIARFWSRVDVGDPDDCWPWLAGRRKRKYGGFKIGSVSVLAHRVAFFLHYGYWPENALHTCDEPSCVNPFHLLDGDQAQNMGEAASRERMASKLTLAQVQEIRQSNAKGIDLAQRFGVSKGLISMIRSGKARTHAIA
jgi:hypothetical protein